VALWRAESLPSTFANVVNDEVDISLVDGRRTTTTVCFTDGTAKDAQKLSALYGSLDLFYSLNASNYFGASLAMLGDIDSDGSVDLAVGALDDDGGIRAGAVYLLFLESSGMVKYAQKISHLHSNLNVFYSLDAYDRFGNSVAALGDIDGDSVVDLAVGAFFDDDGGENMGAVYCICALPRN